MRGGERVGREMLGFWVLFACIWVSIPSSANADTDQSDVSCLNVLFSSLNSPAQLTSWTASGGDPYGQSWKGITCSGVSVTEIWVCKLSGLGLNGNLGYQMNSMTSLIELDMSNNNLGSGNQIPYGLPPNLQRLNLAGNSFNGPIPYSISLITSLEYINLGHNQLQGNLTDTFGQLSNLSTMDLSSNSFAGDLPKNFSSLSSLTTLFMQNNQFMGSIDVLANLPLEDLNVANNRFTGWIPDQIKKINNLQTGGNSWSSGSAPPPPPYTPPPSGRRINPGQGPGGGGKSPSNSGGDGGGGEDNSCIGGGAIADIIIYVLVVSAVLAFFLIRRKKRKSLSEETPDPEQPFTPLASNEVKGWLLHSI